MKVLYGFFGVALLAFPASAQLGSVLHSEKIGDQLGGFGSLTVFSFFGGALAPLGDLNGDGVADLAVGACGDDDGGDEHGALWLLFLGANGSVQSTAKISQAQGGFAGTLADVGHFGRRLTALGDLDGDGVPELATTSRLPNELWILFLKADGSLKSQRRISYSDPVFVPATNESVFEGVVNNVLRMGGIAGLGDLDGDGVGDIAVGAPGDPDGGPQTGAVWILRLNADGSPKAAQKISRSLGGFGGTLDAHGTFGSSLVRLGDLDGDGHPELGVGALGTHEFWVLTLDPSGLVLAQHELGADYGLRVTGGHFLTNDDAFEALGDLDGDGVTEVAAGFARTDFPGGPDGEGGFALDFLENDGSVRTHLGVSRLRGGFGPLPGNSRFGESFAPLGDLDGDGTQELAVGAPQTNGDGVVWILSLDPDASRNGSGLNPQILAQASAPVFGAPWSVTLDCTGHASGVAAVWGYDRASAGTFLPYGEVLVAGNRVFELLQPHASGPVTFTPNLPPPVIALIDLPISVQGACSGAPLARLSNALDVLIGR
jgi:hypothetical protein